MAAKTKTKGKGKKGTTEATPAAGEETTFSLADGKERCLGCGAARKDGEATCHDCGYEYAGPPPIVGEEWVDPAEVREGENSRVEAAADYLGDVHTLAVDIFINGQINPAECRTDDTGKRVLISGYTRRDAVAALREGFTAPHPFTGETFLFRDPERKLWVKVINVTPEQAFLRSLAENLKRKSTTDLQDALAQDHLRTVLGWTDTRIAQFYGATNQNRVLALKKLLKLDKKTRDLVHRGKLALSAALLTESLTDEERESVIAGAADGDKIRGEGVASLVRELLLARASGGKAEEIPDAGEPEKVTRAKDAARTPEEKTSKLPKRSRVDLQRWLQEQDEAGEGLLKPEVQDFLGVLFKYLDGTRNDASLRSKLYALNDAVKSKV